MSDDAVQGAGAGADAEPAPNDAARAAQGRGDPGHQADAARRRRLRWRARRGLLENDLILTRFLDRFEDELTDVDVGALDRLLDCNDNELMDMILGRSEPQGELATEAVQQLVRRLRDV